MTPIKPWLPRSLEFLSGLPTRVRKRRVIVPIQVFCDESGGKGQTRHFLIAALMCHAEAWALFTDEWLACLEANPRIKYFKMKEAAGYGGQFHIFTQPQRDAKLRDLARIINRYARCVTYSCIDLDAHAEILEGFTSKPFNEAYFRIYQNTIIASCFELWDAGLRERFEIIFDTQVIFGPRARGWYAMVQNIMQMNEPEAATILPVDPMFRDDREFFPLQAADLFAWCIRDATDIGGDGEFQWLLGELKDVALSDYSQYYDRERMNSIVKQVTQIERDGAIPVELIDKFRRHGKQIEKR